jgi:8-oxo-dGTP pyrophosphatase MutT (NUDIX family)
VSHSLSRVYIPPDHPARLRPKTIKGFRFMIMTRRRLRFEPLIRRSLHTYWRFARGMTLGARAVVLDADNRVFMVKHTYTPGWHLPGGGVETGETLLESLTRELHEEGGIELTGAPRLHGMFFKRKVSRRDHVAVYVARDWRQEKTPEPNREIVACSFFDGNDLPPDTTPGTRRRIEEVLHNRPLIEDWS